MKQGQPFNISRVEGVIRIPLIMIKDRNISFAAKTLYGLLMRHSGSVGYCAVTQQKLADEMRVSRGLIKVIVASLRRRNYITMRSDGYHRPARYYFLWRDEFKVKKGSYQDALLDPELHTRIIKEALARARNKAKS